VVPATIRKAVGRPEKYPITGARSGTHNTPGNKIDKLSFNRWKISRKKRDFRPLGKWGSGGTATEAPAATSHGEKEKRNGRILKIERAKKTVLVLSAPRVPYGRRFCRAKCHDACAHGDEIHQNRRGLALLRRLRFRSGDEGKWMVFHKHHLRKGRDAGKVKPGRYRGERAFLGENYRRGEKSGAGQTFGWKPPSDVRFESGREL